MKKQKINMEERKRLAELRHIERLIRELLWTVRGAINSGKKSKRKR